MKIAQIVTRSDNMGGAQVHVKDLSMELQKYGLEVHVLCGGKGPFPGKQFYILAEKIAGLVSSRVITVSEYDREFCLKHHILPLDKITTVHNGIPDLPDCSDGLTVSTPTKLFMTARLEKPKNHMFLLRVLSQLTKRDDWVLDLVGDGPLRAEVEEVIIKLNLVSRIHMLGARNDVPQLLKQADIFILISDWEGLPLSILEAMRAGLPVIASDVGGVSEAVEDDVNGFLIPKGDAELLKDKLAALLNSEELRLRMGEASRKKFRKSFTISRMVEKTISVYNSAIARKSQALLKIN